MRLNVQSAYQSQSRAHWYPVAIPFVQIVSKNKILLVIFVGVQLGNVLNYILRRPAIQFQPESRWVVTQPPSGLQPVPH